MLDDEALEDVIAGELLYLGRYHHLRQGRHRRRRLRLQLPHHL